MITKSKIENFRKRKIGGHSSTQTLQSSQAYIAWSPYSSVRKFSLIRLRLSFLGVFRLFIVFYSSLGVVPYSIVLHSSWLCLSSCHSLFIRNGLCIQLNILLNLHSCRGLGPRGFFLFWDDEVSFNPRWQCFYQHIQLTSTFWELPMNLIQVQKPHPQFLLTQPCFYMGVFGFWRKHP